MPLSIENLQELRQIVRRGTNSTLEKRCQCILYHSYGMSIQELSELFDVSQRSIHNWLIRWKKGGIDGLYDKAGRGKKPKLDPSDPHHVEAVQKALLKYPYDSQQALAELNRQLPQPVSQSTLLRFRKRECPPKGQTDNEVSLAC